MPIEEMAEIEIGSWTGQLGSEPTVSAYVGHLVHVMRLVRRVLRDDGSLWLNLGDSFANDSKWGGSTGGKHVKALHGSGQIGRQKRKTGLKAKDLMMVPARVALALQADGWFLRSTIIWAKGVSFCSSYAGSSMPESVTDRPARTHEKVYLLTKKKKYYYDIEAVKEKAAASTVARSHLGRCEISDGQRALIQNGFHSATESLRDYSRETRNLRSVWVINPEASSAKHYAGFPSALVAPMIRAGSSERGVCASCGSPYERVVERTEITRPRPDGSTRERNRGGRKDGFTKMPNGVAGVSTKTIGWRPTCSCDAGEPIPATVLDIFAGTSTTASVAQDLGRCSIMIEAAPEYVRMSRDRTAQHHLF